MMLVCMLMCSVKIFEPFERVKRNFCACNWSQSEHTWERTQKICLCSAKEFSQPRLGSVFWGGRNGFGWWKRMWDEKNLIKMQIFPLRHINFFSSSWENAPVLFLVSCHDILWENLNGKKFKEWKMLKFFDNFRNFSAKIKTIKFEKQRSLTIIFKYMKNPKALNRLAEIFFEQILIIFNLQKKLK